MSSSAFQERVRRDVWQHGWDFASLKFYVLPDGRQQAVGSDSLGITLYLVESSHTDLHVPVFWHIFPESA